MNTKLLECKREAKDFVQSKDAPSKADGEKHAWLYGDNEATLEQ